MTDSPERLIGSRSGIQAKVSIVCITYNHEKLIERALQGFVKQKTNFPFEAIIADDCSTDNTPSIIQKYAKEYPTIIKPILRDKNIGSLPNYRDAVSKANGQYLATCDGDDYWTDEFKLAKQVEFMDTHPDFSMCCHPFVQTYLDGSSPDIIISPWELVSAEAKARGYLTFQDFFPINPVGSLTAFYRRDLVQELPAWMEKYKIADLVMHLLHADKGKVGVLEDVMAVYQRHAGGVWYQNDTIEHQHKVAVDYANLLTDIDFEFGKKYSDKITPCKGAPLKILFLAMENSIHSYKWIQSVISQNRHEVRLFSSYRIPYLPDIFSTSDRLKIYSPFGKKLKRNPSRSYYSCLAKMIFHPKQTMDLMEKDLFGHGVFFKTSKFGNLELFVKNLLMLILRPRHAQMMIAEGTFRDGYVSDNEKTLEMVIKEFQPDIIHTLHTQTSAYQLLAVRKKLNGKFPIWLHSVWGSDLYFWIRHPDHRVQLEEVMHYIDYFIGEGRRDEILAMELGFKGSFFEPMPASGGFDIENNNNDQFIKPSLRKEITVKGYDFGVGRFRDALIALIRAKDVVKDYTINVFSLEMDRGMLDVYINDSGLNINVVPHSSHEEIVKILSKSRISIGCSFSDGIPATFLEAMACGAFPIQTNTAITEGWVEDGVSALLVPPDDVIALEKAIRRAMSDNELVDDAAMMNLQTIHDKANINKWNLAIEKIYNNVGYKFRD